MSDTDARPLSLGILTGSMSRRAGGLFNSVRKSALHLAGTGMAVSIYAGEDDYSAEDCAAWAPLAPRVLPRRGPVALGYSPGLGSVLREGGHDVLHLHGIWQLPSLALLRWKRATGRPVMISPRGMLDPWAVANSAFKKRVASVLFEQRNLRQADCLHALNAAEAGAMRAYGLDNPIAIIPNGADLPELAPSMPREGKRTLLFLGRIHPKKGLRELLAAWALLRAVAPEQAGCWRLVVAGWDDGGHLDGLRALIAAHGLEDGVELLGPVFGEAKDRLLREADAFILPSHSEGLPMSVLEAWAYRLPVLMTRMCNLPVGFERRAAVEIGTEPGAMAATLGATLARDDLAELGQRGHALAEAEFSWGRIAADHKQVYDWLCGRADRPACVILD